MLASRHVGREVRGPAPCSVALIAKGPRKVPADKIIMDRRKEEDAKVEALKNQEYQKRSELRSHWEKSMDHRIQQSSIRRRIDGILAQNELKIEDRRDRLRSLLSYEESFYLSEMEEKEETPLDRQARMRDRAKVLRERREQERLEIVKEKYDQQFRDQCEELRMTLTRRGHDEITADRMAQLQEKDYQRQQDRETDAMWARLWKADMEAKAKREEEDAQSLLNRNMATVEALKMQMAALEEKKKEEKSLQSEERKLLEDQLRIKKLEEQKEHQEKLRRRAEAKQLFESSLREKMWRTAKEVQEQLAFDMKILEQLLEESKNEAIEQVEKKRRAMEENRRYREYLKAMAEEEKRRERELEKMLDAEVERGWQKRIQQWRTERAARKKLLDQVVATLKEQIAEKRARNGDKQIIAKQQREELLRAIEQNKELDREERRKILESAHNHQQDLLQQIEYNAVLKQHELHESEREFICGQEAEMEYQAKIREALENPHATKTHPFRRRAMQLNC